MTITPKQFVNRLIISESIVLIMVASLATYLTVRQALGNEVLVEQGEITIPERHKSKDDYYVKYWFWHNEGTDDLFIEIQTNKYAIDPTIYDVENIKAYKDKHDPKICLPGQGIFTKCPYDSSSRYYNYLGKLANFDANSSLYSQTVTLEETDEHFKIKFGLCYYGLKTDRQQNSYIQLMDTTYPLRSLSFSNASEFTEPTPPPTPEPYAPEFKDPTTTHPPNPTS